MRIDFTEVSIKGVKRWVDADGKKRQKTKTFYQTINPWNKNIDGTLKPREEIMVEIKAARDTWIMTEDAQ